MENDFRIYKGLLAFCIIFFVVFFSNDCLASYSEDFDSDPDNTGISDATHATAWRWAYPATANLLFQSTSTQSYSSPYSVRNLRQGGNALVYATSTTGEKTNFSMWAYVPSSNANSYIYVYFLDEDTHYIGGMKITAGANSLIWYKNFSALTAPISLNQYLTDGNWHKHEFEYDKSTGLMSYSLDSGYYSTTTLPFGQYSSLGKAMRGFGFNNPSTGITPSYSVFIDDISFYGNSDLPPSVDYLSFYRPFYNNDYNVYNFYWELLYELSTTTIANYPTEKLGLSVEWKNTDTGVIGLPTTTGIAKISTLNLSEFLPDTIDSYTWNNRIFVPTQLGNYIATATMYHYNYDTLVSTEIISATTTWTMSTGTPESVDSGWCKNLCWDIASSTTFLDSLTNSIICGGRYVMCYTFQPHDSVVYLVGDSIEKIKDSFPFNAYFGLTDTVKEAISTTTVDTDATIGLPMIRKTATTSEYYIMPLVGSTTMQNMIGSTNADTVKTTLGWLSWVIVAGIIFVIIS